MSEMDPPIVPPPGTEPVLVYGTGATALDVFVAALARRQQRPFGWIHCAPDLSDLPADARSALEASSEGNRETLQDPEELTIPEHRVRRLSQFFLDEPMTLSFEVRLVAYLGMPAIVQRMVARVLSSDGRSTIVLTHLDAVPPRIAWDCFARPEVPATLRREGVSMLATFRGTPPERLRRAFPRVFRVESSTASGWDAARVTPEEGHHPTCGRSPSDTVADWVAYLDGDRRVPKDPTPPRSRPVRKRAGSENPR